MPGSRSDKHKKLYSTAAFALAALTVFLWLGIGLVGFTDEAKRQALWPLLCLYTAFPLLVGAVSLRRMREIDRISQEDESAAAACKDEAEPEKLKK